MSTVRGCSVDWSCTYFFQFQNTLRVRGSFHRSERPIWSRCAISCRFEVDVFISCRSEVDELFLGRNGRCEVDVLSLADLKSMNYFSVGTADVKSMSYLTLSLGPIWSRWNYSPVWTADSKSMSYFLARTVDRDIRPQGIRISDTDQCIVIDLYYFVVVFLYWFIEQSGEGIVPINMYM